MNDFGSFKKLLGKMESGNNYQAVNYLSGALGKYPFIPSTLDGLQYIYDLPAWVDADNFLNNPALQEKYITAQITDIVIFVERSGLKKFVGLLVTGSKRFSGSSTSINIYGLVAGGHLAGTGNLKKFLENGINVDDGRTSISDYIYYFSKEINPVSLVVPGLIFASVIIYLLY